MSSTPGRDRFLDGGLRRDPTRVLLPLRAFLAVAYLYAGLSKIADPAFLDPAAPASMRQSVLAVRASSPIGGLLGPVADHSFAFGLLMAAGEVAVGLGLLAGLFTRLASLGGMVLALSLFLTVSWNATPWYTGADIGYVFAFTPLLLAGRTPLSLDAWLAGARRRHPGAGEDRTRRLVLAAGAGLAGLAALGVASLFRRSPRAQQAAPSRSASSGSAGGQTLVAASGVPVGGAVQVSAPATAAPLWVMQLQAGRFTAVNATCPHQGCPLKFVSKSEGFACPCHNSRFDAAGTRLSGPANRNLTSVAVRERGGQITTN